MRKIIVNLDSLFIYYFSFVMDRINNEWPKLQNPPVAIALLQLKFDPTAIPLDTFTKYDTAIKRELPNRRDNIQVGLDFKGIQIPIGKSTITSQSDARVGAIVYFSNDQKVKLEFSDGTITFTDERKYVDWDNFQNSAIHIFSLLSESLNNIEILRTSIRFINRFSLKDFTNPDEYFNTLISHKEDQALPFPLRQYSFRLTMDVPDTDIYSIVNQSIENIRPDAYAYTLDIDVLDRQRMIFAESSLIEVLSGLRKIKNEIFFKTLTQKTLDLCN